MKTIGLIGGMSWESSDIYYQIINREVGNKLGDLNSADIVMYSINFYELEKLQRNKRWIEAEQIIAKTAKKIELAGAEFIVICSVTGHEGIGIIENEINVPILHIADCINKRIVGLKKVGLLGTIYTMEKDYFKKKINAEVIIPNKEDRIFINNVIYNEIIQGKLLDNSRNKYKKIIEKLVKEGAEGIILGCTEIPLLIKQEDCSVSVFSSTEIHAKEAVNYSLRTNQADWEDIS